MQKNIGIDITNLDPDYYGGSDTYSNGLINGLINCKSKHKFQIYDPQSTSKIENF